MTSDPSFLKLSKCVKGWTKCARSSRHRRSVSKLAAGVAPAPKSVSSRMTGSPFRVELVGSVAEGGNSRYSLVGSQQDPFPLVEQGNRIRTVERHPPAPNIG